MIEITRPAATGRRRWQPRDRLELPFELRQKSRLRTRARRAAKKRGSCCRAAKSCAAATCSLAEGRARGRSRRAAGALLHVECDTPHALARAAYHLGNRHVPVEVGEGYLRLAADHVLEQMLTGLGARVTAIEAPFEPEAGAYAGPQRTAAGAHHARRESAGRRAYTR